MSKSNHVTDMVTHEQIIAEASRLVSEGVSVTIPVKGRSMIPFIVGDRDSVILAKPSRPAVGDVVLARVDGDRYVIHRVVALDGENVTLMGDGNLSATERCSTSDIMALATHTVSTRGKKRYLYTWRLRQSARLWRWLRPVRRWLLPVVAKIIRSK